MFLAAAVLLVLVGEAASAQSASVWKTIDSTRSRYYIDNPLLSASADDHVLVSKGMGVGLVVLRSTDAGDSWRTLRAHEFTSRYFSAAHPMPELVVIVGDSTEYFVRDGASTGRRYWGMMELSRDGGSTWESHVIDSNVHLTSIAMVGTQGVILAKTDGNVYNDAAAHAPDSLLITADAWRTHTATPVPPSIMVAARVMMPEPGVILVVSYDTNMRQTYLYRTDDKGLTWTRSQALPPFESISFTSPLEAWSAGGVRTGSGDRMRDVIARSTDGGMTWTVVVDSTLPGMPLGLVAIDFADDMNGVAVGRGGKIVRTSDGGVTWTQEFVDHGVNQASSLRAISVPRADRAIAVSVVGPIFTYAGEQTLSPPKYASPTGSYPLAVDSVTVKWTRVAGALRYRLQVASQSVDNWYYDETMFDRALVDTVLADTQMVLRNLQYWHRHHVRIKALDDTRQSEWGNGAFHTLKEGAVAPPRFLSPGQGALNQPLAIRISWEPVPGATSYDLAVGTNRFFVPPLAFDDSLLTTTEQLVSGLEPNTEYLVRVRARLKSSTTDWSPSLGFQTAATAAIDAATSRDAVARISVRPNPSHGDEIIVTLSVDTRDALIEIVTVTGEIVSSVRSDRDVVVIPTIGLTSGVYFVRVKGESSAPIPVTITR